MRFTLVDFKISPLFFCELKTIRNKGKSSVFAILCSCNLMQNGDRGIKKEFMVWVSNVERQSWVKKKRLSIYILKHFLKFFLFPFWFWVLYFGYKTACGFSFIIYSIYWNDQLSVIASMYSSVQTILKQQRIN